MTAPTRANGVCLMLVVATLAACSTDVVPSTPSFQQDVLPILAANCVRCHGTRPLSGIAYMRLDAYADTEPHGGEPIAGAGNPELAALIAMRVADDDRPMPPRFGLDAAQIELLQVWAAQGAPRGAPRPGNRPPVATLLETRPRIEIAVSDPDRDLVSGEVILVLGSGPRTIGTVASGRHEVELDTTDIPAGIYPLLVRLDDGAEPSTLELGTIQVGRS